MIIMNESMALGVLLCACYYFWHRGYLFGAVCLHKTYRDDFLETWLRGHGPKENTLHFGVAPNH